MEAMFEMEIGKAGKPGCLQALEDFDKQEKMNVLCNHSLYVFF